MSQQEQLPRRNRNSSDEAPKSLDPDVYWPQGTGPKEILFKQSMSGACDAMTQYCIHVEHHLVSIEQMTLNGKAFISSSMLQDFVLLHLPLMEGVEAFNDDNVDSWTPKITPWKIVIRMGGLRLRATVWNHRPGLRGESRVTVEFFPETEFFACES